VFENNRECFHCDGTHPELMNSFVENLSVEGVGGKEDPVLVGLWDRCVAGGLPSRLVMGVVGQVRMGRVPVASGAVSGTVDG
jgi:Rieske 2Fe-2S family protein